MISINVFVLVLILPIALLVGYWARKYIEKKYPDRAAALDAVVKEFGVDAEAKVKQWRDEAKDKS